MRKPKTTPTTHEIIKENINKSSMYGGLNDVTGVGPRYCPSIEDKVMRFKDKERHQLFLEPESIYYDDIYLQGFSTSMPYEIQEQMVHSLPGLEHAKITKYAYAIEYDAIDPLQINPSLESKVLSGLFTAGQINGTSGYRIWSDGYCEQWGHTLKEYATITFLKRFINTNYQVYITPNGTPNTTNISPCIVSKSDISTNIYVDSNGGENGADWKASGYLASGQY